MEKRQWLNKIFRYTRLVINLRKDLENIRNLSQNLKRIIIEIKNIKAKVVSDQSLIQLQLELCFYRSKYVLKLQLEV